MDPVVVTGSADTVERACHDAAQKEGHVMHAPSIGGRRTPSRRKADPYNVVEVARYLDTSGPNDGLANDFWGVHKEANSPYIFGSDRNGGLYIFKEKGIGTVRKGK